LNLSVEQLDEVGNTEMLPWAAVLGAIGQQHMELLSYQPTSHHGHAVVRFHSGPKPDARSSQPFEFHNAPYTFYKHPAISAYRLNKLLYESRCKPHLRRRLLKDPKAVGTEYGLRAEEIAVLQSVCELSNNNSEKPARDADPLVGIGAHPVGALMAVHVLQAEQRKGMQSAEHELK
jgi:hypothetical protein